MYQKWHVRLWRFGAFIISLDTSRQGLERHKCVPFWIHGALQYKYKYLLFGCNTLNLRSKNKGIGENNYVKLVEMMFWY